jgi:hypothetical protein
MNMEIRTAKKERPMKDSKLPDAIIGAGPIRLAPALALGGLWQSG